MLIPGTKLGAYEILSIVGSGGMGEVYRALDLRLDRVVAIKVVSESVAQCADFYERFDRESRALARLSHPHICAVFDVGSQDGLSYFVMEYLEGSTLSQRLAERPIPQSDAFLWGMQIADALDQSHRRGITHRDLKPSNVMLTRSGVKLLDFGLAQNSTVNGGLPPSRLTGNGTILGTLPYMAPEQLTGANTDPRTDVFALGTILYEMFTGVNPFLADTRADTIAAVLTHDPPNIGSPILDHILKRCVAKPPDERWQTARDVMLELEFAGERAGEAPTRGRVVRLSPEPWIYATTALLILACLCAYIAFRISEPSAIALSVTPPGEEGIGSFAVSPDGKKLVLAGAGRSQHLWVRFFDSPDARMIGGTEDASYPFWSADSESIGFFAAGKLKKISITGGTPQSLADAPRGMGGTWNRDGVIIFTPDIFNGLSTISASGGEPEPLTTKDLALTENSHRWPQFLSDQRHYLYMVRSKSPESGVFLAELGSQKRVRLLSNASAAAYTGEVKGGLEYLVFSRDNVLMAQRLNVKRGRLEGEALPVAERVSADPLRNRGYFSSSLHGTIVYQQFADKADLKQVVFIDRMGMQHDEPLATGIFNHFSLSPDGNEVAVQRATADGLAESWTFNRKGHSEQRIAINKTFPVWSRDGTRILMLTGTGLFGLQHRARDGAEQSPILLESKAAKIPLDWAPGDQWILYQKFDDRSKFDLVLARADGRQPPIPYIHSPANETDGQFSPDGRWLAYVSDESSGVQVYVQRFLGAESPPGPRWQVSELGGVKPRWRRDGKELFFIDPQHRMMSCEVGISGSAFEHGTPRSLFPTRLALDPLGQQYDSMPGNKGFIMLLPVESARLPLTVLMNWRGAPRPLTALAKGRE